MQTVAVAPPLHGSTGELIDDNHLAVLDYIVHVLFEQDVGLQ